MFIFQKTWSTLFAQALCSLIAILLFVNAASAQTVSVIRNDSAATTVQSNNLGNSKLATNDKGVLYVSFASGAGGDIANITTSVTPGTAAANLGKAEDAVNTNGATGVLGLAIRVDSGGSTAGSDGDYAALIQDNSGNLWTAVTGSTRALNPYKIEDVAAADGDAGVAILARANPGLNSTSTNTGDYTSPAVSNSGVGLNTLVYDANIVTSVQAVNKEDNAHASGDAGVAVFGVIQTTLTAPAANGDYASPALGMWGETLAMLVYDQSYPVDRSPFILEDTTMTTDGSAGMRVTAQTQDPLTEDQSGSGDAAYLKVDKMGRTITTLAPAGETWNACSAVVTTTGDTTLKAAVASNRIYVTQISCANNSAVPSQFIVRDGASTAISTGGVGTLAATGGGFPLYYPVPLRLPVNSALLFNLVTTGTSTTCCASGYISVN